MYDTDRNEKGPHNGPYGSVHFPVRTAGPTLTAAPAQSSTRRGIVDATTRIGDALPFSSVISKQVNSGVLSEPEASAVKVK